MRYFIAFFLLVSGLLFTTAASGSHVEKVWWADSQGNPIQTAYLGDAVEVHAILKISGSVSVTVEIKKDISLGFDASMGASKQSCSAPRCEITARFVPDQLTTGNLRGYYAVVTAPGYESYRFGGNDGGTSTENELKVSEVLVKRVALDLPTELPPGMPYSLSVVTEAIEYWNRGGNGKLSQKARIVQASGNAVPDFTVQWIKEFGGSKAGQAQLPEYTEGSSLMQIELGRTEGGRWRPYTKDFMLHVAKHEIGHILGLRHNPTDPNDIMYPAVPASIPKFQPETPSQGSAQAPRAYAPSSVSPRQPGFEAIAGIAGLLAVALILRRRTSR